MSTADRFVSLIARATGVTLDPRTAVPSVVGDKLKFFATADETAPLVEALVGVHGIDPAGIGVTWVDADCIDLPSYVGATDALISLSLPALASRLAALQAVRS
jgi:hypothetical protein